LFMQNKDTIIALNLNTGVASHSIPYDPVSVAAPFNCHA